MGVGQVWQNGPVRSLSIGGGGQLGRRRGRWILRLSSQGDTSPSSSAPPV